MSHTTHTFLATRELYSSNESIHSRQINEIKISSFELVRIEVVFFLSSFIFFTVVWHLRDRCEYEDTIGEMAFARAHHRVVIDHQWWTND